MVEYKENTIYSSVPSSAISDNSITDLTQREKLLSVLQGNKGIPFTAQKLAMKCGFPMKGSNVETRKAITELIEVDGYPICSGSKGFFYPNSKEEIKAYIESLESRKNGIDRRINALTNIILREY